MKCQFFRGHKSLQKEIVSLPQSAESKVFYGTADELPISHINSLLKVCALIAQKQKCMFFFMSIKLYDSHSWVWHWYERFYWNLLKKGWKDFILLFSCHYMSARNKMEGTGVLKDTRSTLDKMHIESWDI